MNKVKIYTTDFCGYCSAAKALLNSRGILFTEIKIDEDDDESWNTLIKKSGMRTVPQIFYEELLIGGFNELSILDKKDNLASLKK